MGNPVFVESKTRTRTTEELRGLRYMPYTPTPSTEPHFYIDLTGEEPVVLNYEHQEELIDLWRGRIGL